MSIDSSIKIYETKMEAPGCGNLGKKNCHKNRKNYGYFHPYIYIFLKQRNENRKGAQSVSPFSQKTGATLSCMAPEI
jgi:hypothetical protein